MLSGHKRMSVADERMFTKKQAISLGVYVIKPGAADFC